MRAAIGRAASASPSLLTRQQLGSVFRTFDADGSGSITYTELGAAAAALGVPLPPSEVKELLTTIDADGSGDISLDEFEAWWDDVVSVAGASPVTYIHTAAQFDTIIGEEGASSRLVVLEVGFTFCKPCARFEPIFKAHAERNPAHRFLRMDGNLNADLVRLGRDVLGVETTPSFFFYRNGALVHRASGANEDKFLATLKEAAAGAPALA